MLRKITSSWIFSTTQIVVFTILFGTSLSTFCLDGKFVGVNLKGEHKYNLKITKTDEYWYTPSFRPEQLPKVVSSPFQRERNILPSRNAFIRGGTIVGDDERQQITDTPEKHWSVHGLLTMTFDDKPYVGSGTLISAGHVQTSGDNLFDPERGIWADNILFHPGRNGDYALHTPVRYTKKAVCKAWKYGVDDANVGVIELAEDVGNKVGWNGLLAGTDSFVKRLDPVNVTGFAIDKPPGTMWTDPSRDWIEVKGKQITYKLSAFAGQNGANAWVGREEPEGFYSVGVHNYGIQDGDMGIYNIATRTTKNYLEGIVHLINDVF